MKKITLFLSASIFCFSQDLSQNNQNLNNSYTFTSASFFNYGTSGYEIDGFIIHFFSKKTIQNLINGYENLSIDYFEEGSFPRKLFFVCNKKKN